MSDLTTKFGGRQQRQGRARKVSGGISAVLGGATAATGAISMATGNFVVGGGATMLSAMLLKSAQRDFSRGKRLIAKGRATEQIIHRARGQGGLRADTARRAPPRKPPATEMRGGSGNDQLRAKAQTLTWPRPLDVIQTASSVTAEAALVAGAQAARDARKSVKLKELKAAVREAKIPGRSQLRNKAALLEALDRSGIKSVAGKSLNKAFGAANPVLIGASSLMSASGAYNTARNAGASRGKAIAAGALAASPTAVAVVAPSLLARVAPKAAAGLVRAAPWLLLASAGISAVREGYKAYQEGKGAGAVAGRAALGAADAISFGLATKAYDAMSGRSKAAPPSTPDLPPMANPNEPVIKMAQAAGQMIADPALLRPDGDPRMGPKEKAAVKALGDASHAQAGTRYARNLIKGERSGDPAAAAIMGGLREKRAGSGTGPQRLTPEQALQFRDANAEQMGQSANIPDPSTFDQSARRPGWGPEARIAAAQSRGAANLPYGGDPSKAPDYVDPLSKERKSR